CEGTVSHPSDGKPCGSLGFIAPKHTYPVAQGSCGGITIIRDVLYIACERGTRLYRAELTAGGSMSNTQPFFVGTFGRLRTVEPTPDGTCGWPPATAATRTAPRTTAIIGSSR